MALESKEILKALGLPEDLEDITKVVSKHNESYLLKSEAHEDDDVKSKTLGAALGSIDTEAKRLFGFSSEDIKGHKTVEILKKGVEKFKSQITELQGASSDEIVKKKDKEIETLKGQFEQYKGELEKVVQEKQELEANFTTKLKDYKVKNHLRDSKSKLAFVDKISDVSKRGFDAVIEDKYTFDLDDKDNFVVRTKDGKKVTNPKQSGTFLSPDEVLNMELEAAGLKKLNNQKGGNELPWNNTERKSAASEDRPVRKPHSRAMQYEDKAVQ